MNIFSFGGGSSSSKSNTISKYIENLKVDIHTQMNKLITDYPNGYKLILLQNNLNDKYFEYEKKLKEDKVSLSLINKFKTDCSSLKNIMEENYKNHRKEVCANVLTSICADHSKIIYDVNIDNLDYDEIQRRYDINCNVMSAKLYNSVSGWTWDNEDQLHNMVKESLDIIKEAQSNRLDEIRAARYQNVRQVKLTNELNNIEQQRKKQRKDSVDIENEKIPSKKESLAEQKRKAKQFMEEQNSKSLKPAILKTQKAALDDIDDSPRPTTTITSRKRKSLDDIEADDNEFQDLPNSRKCNNVKQADNSKTKLQEGRVKAQQWEEQQGKRQLSNDIDKPENETKSKKDVLAEARRLAAAEMEARMVAATANKSEKKTSKKKK